MTSTVVARKHVLLYRPTTRKQPFELVADCITEEDEEDWVYKVADRRKDPPEHVRPLHVEVGTIHVHHFLKKNKSLQFIIRHGKHLISPQNIPFFG